MSLIPPHGGTLVNRILAPNAAQRANNQVKQSDTSPGHFCCPHGATWDSKGNIFVVEWLPYGRVTKLKKV
jgi:hypothetical protein